MQSGKKCSTKGCIHWAWQEGQCKFHYANSRKTRSPSLGSQYEYMPYVSSSSTYGRRSSSTPDISGFDVKRLMTESQETTFTMIKPESAQYLNIVEAIATRFMKEGFVIMEYRKIHLSSQIATELYKIHKEKVWFSELLDYVTKSPCVIFALKKENAIQDLRKLVGPTDPNEARKTDFDSLRALYGTSKQCNAVHCSDSLENAKRELEIFFTCNTFNHGDSSSFSSSKVSTSESQSILS